MPSVHVYAGNPPAWLGIANVIGDVIWIIAYVLIIRQGFKDRTYGMPMLCIALNFTWEFLYAIKFPFEVSIIEALRLAWLLADAVIVYQLFRYGRDGQTIPLVKQYFYVVCGVMFVSAYVGQLAFHYSYSDSWGENDAYMINLVMSVLFIYLYLTRVDRKGLSLGAAWAKMLGTGILSAAGLLDIYLRGLNWLQWSFLIFLYVMVFAFDVLYIVFLSRSRAQAAAQTEDRRILAAA